MRPRTVRSTMLAVLSLIAVLPAMAEKAYDYHINLVDMNRNMILITLKCADFGADELIYHFPKTVPGTYKEADYGRFVKQFSAQDNNGNELPVKKSGKNSYIISNAAGLESLSYWLAPTWDKKYSLKVWPMAGTGFKEGEYFALNSGPYGYFEGEELNPVKLTFTTPSNLYPMTVLEHDNLSDGRVEITARDYHHLVDCPIMFAPPDTSTFNVHGAVVEVNVLNETMREGAAKHMHEALEPAMYAIGTFLDSLPVERYAYIMYYRDAERLGEILNERWFKGFKTIGWVIKNGIPAGGALEHNTSSFYWLPDLGPRFREESLEMMSDISIHEFMHIITPLNLHSEHINNFNYADPVMSKHLWLYEGITEYFAGIIQVHGGIEPAKRYITRTLRSKIKNGEKYPNEKMSFTEMSANVFEKPYKRNYMQVYQRGAAMGAMLDIEIIRLTEGEKTLIDVLMTLIDRYGQYQAFPEEGFIDEFCAEVHPDLRDFFTKYVEGREDIPYDEILAHVGVEYLHAVTESAPQHPIEENDLKKSSGIVMGHWRPIKKVGRHERLGFEAGDLYERGIYFDHYMDEQGQWVPEGTVVEFEIKRDGEFVTLRDTVKYIDKEQEYRLRIMKEPTEQQTYFFNVWTGIQEPGQAIKIPGLPAEEALEPENGESLP